MTDIISFGLLYVIMLLAAVCFFALCALVVARAVNGIEDWLKRTRAEPQTPQQPDGLPPLICPSHGLEHLCRSDPIDTANLAAFEVFLAKEDKKWVDRMNRRLKAE